MACCWSICPRKKCCSKRTASIRRRSRSRRTPATISPYTANLQANIERLKLDVERIVPVHYPADNRKVMDKELLIAVGKSN